jgi:hypothetical protein
VAYGGTVFIVEMFPLLSTPPVVVEILKKVRMRNNVKLEVSNMREQQKTPVRENAVNY